MIDSSYIMIIFNLMWILALSVKVMHLNIFPTTQTFLHIIRLKLHYVCMNMKCVCVHVQGTKRLNICIRFGPTKMTLVCPLSDFAQSISSSSQQSICVRKAESKRECSFPPGCAIICFTVSHVDSDTANRLWFNREKQQGGEDCEGLMEVWRSGSALLSFGELSQQQCIKLARLAIFCITSGWVANSQ